MAVISNQVSLAAIPEQMFDNGGPVAVTFTGRVQPAAGGARLLVDFDARARGWFRVAFPLFLLIMKRQEKANMAHLRKALEHRVASGDSPRRSR